MEKICLRCKNKFITWNSKQKLCSKKCSAGYYRINYSGENNKNYGIKKSEITKQRIRNAKIGPSNPAFGKIPWNKGISLSEEIKNKISQTKREKLNKGLIKVWNKGKKTGQKVWNKGLTSKSNFKIAEISKKGSQTKANLFKNPEYRERFRTRSSLSHKEYYKAHPEALERMKNIRSKIIYPKKDTKIEVKMQNALRARGIKFLTHYPFYNKICETKIDIALVEQKIAIYCDGDYWHNLPNYIERDIKITTELSRNSWRVLRFWEHQINTNIDLCINKVLQEIKNVKEI